MYIKTYIDMCICNIIMVWSLFLMKDSTFLVIQMANCSIGKAGPISSICWDPYICILAFWIQLFCYGHFSSRSLRPSYLTETWSSHMIWVNALRPTKSNNKTNNNETMCKYHRQSVNQCSDAVGLCSGNDNACIQLNLTLNVRGPD